MKWGVRVTEGKDLVTVGICDSRQEAEQINARDHDGKGTVTRIRCLL
jgi:hypothetical protein